MKEFNTKARLRIQKDETRCCYKVVFEMQKKNGDWYQIRTRDYYYDFRNNQFAADCMNSIFNNLTKE